MPCHVGTYPWSDQELADLWNEIKKNYAPKGTLFEDMVPDLARRLGLKNSDIIDGILNRPKVAKKTTLDAWNTQRNVRSIENRARYEAENINRPAWLKSKPVQFLS